MYRRFPAIALCIVLATACGGKGDKANSTPSTFPAVDAAKDAVLASNMVLAGVDVPDGFTEDNSGAGVAAGSMARLADAELPGSCQKLRADAGNKNAKQLFSSAQDSAMSTGKTFKKGEDVFTQTFNSTVVLKKTAADARNELATMEDQRSRTCLQDAYRLIFAKKPFAGTDFTGAKLEAIDDLSSSDSYGLRLVATAHANRQTQNVYIDVLFVLADRAELSATFTAVNARPSLDTERQLLDKLRSKARQQLSAPPS